MTTTSTAARTAAEGPDHASAALTDALCALAHDLRHADLPPGARAATTRALGNAVSLMVGAARHPAVDIAVSALDELSGPDTVPLLGRGERLPGTWAALVHGIAGHVEDYDDTHPATIVHPGVPVVAAALSAAHRAGAPGAELLTAVAVGMEATLRIGRALVPEARDRGWHMTGVAAPVGAALAAGRLGGLDERRLRHAAGIAATQSGGLLEALGTMAKSLQPARAAAAGYEAAVLAEHGLDGPAAPVEGRRGLLALHAGRVDGAPAAAADLGARWELEGNEIKPYACGVVSHAIIDVAVEARRRDSRQPQTVRLHVHPFVLVAMGRTDPADGLEAKFSATHCFAVGHRLGHADPSSFSDETVRTADIVALRRRVELVADESVPRYGVHAEIADADGATWRVARDHPTALDDDGVARKALALTGPVLGDRAATFVDAAFDPAGPSAATLLSLGALA